MAIGFPAPSGPIGSVSQTLTPPVSSAFLEYGSSTGISENYAIVGVWTQEVSGVAQAGTAYIYDPADGNLLFTLDNPEGVTSRYGFSVDISDTAAIVGSYQHPGTGSGIAGKAFLFNPTDGSLIATITNPYTNNTSRQFGYSVAASDSYVLVSSYRDGDTGRAHLYNASNGSLLHSFTAADQHYGYDVDVSDTYSIVGSGKYSTFVEDGKAYVYNNSTGSLVYTFTNPNAYGAVGDQFGASVGISASYAIVGAPYEDDAVGSNRGKAYVYNLSDGSLLYTLDNPADNITQALGKTVEINESYAFVGNGNTKILIFDLSDGSLVNTIVDTGSYMDASDTRLIGGDPAQNVDGFTSAGSAYIHSISSGSQTFTFNNRDYIYNSTKSAWEVYSPITVAQSGSPVSDLSELADSTSILDDPANTVLTYADLNAILAVTNPATGQLAFNLDTSDMYIFGGTNWQKVYDEDDVPVVLYWYGDRAVSNNGIVDATYSNTIEYFDITTLGNASSFGTSTVTGAYWGSVSDTTYAVSARGLNQSTIEYVTIATTGNATNFGTMISTSFRRAGASDGSRGLFASQGVDIEYITIATPSDALDFGDLNFTNGSTAGGSDGTYALWGGTSSNGNNIDYVTIQTAGNGTAFGNLTIGRAAGAASSDDTRTIFTGGVDGINNDPTVDYVTTATPSNATDFGDLLALQYNHAATGNSTRAVVIGGEAGGSSNVIQYMTYQTPGNATDFGDIAGLTSANGATSGAAA